MHPIEPLHRTAAPMATPARQATRAGEYANRAESPEEKARQTQLIVRLTTLADISMRGLVRCAGLGEHTDNKP